MTTRVPRIGETVSVTGFRVPRPSPIQDSTFVRFEGGLYVADGTVSAFHQSGRDSVLMPYATIEIDCGSLGGMSGGAVLDADGRLLGVVSRGFESDDGDGPTYASWALTVLDRRVDLSWPERRTVMLLDLPDDQLEIYGRERHLLEGSTLRLAPW
jgi:hypothetical protein